MPRLASADFLMGLRTAVTATPVVLQDGDHGIPDDVIPSESWAVLLRLRMAGHDTYLVGGAVRDVLLGGTPKDTDILTSASAKQVCALFRRARIVGRAFPICHVPAGPATLEVSSLATTAAGQAMPPDAAARAAAGQGLLTHDGGAAAGRRSEARRRRKRAGAAKAGGDGTGADGATDGDSLGTGASEQAAGPLWSEARRDNAIQRDFTVNGLLYDPFSRTLFDYVGGVADCRRRTLRSIGPAAASFSTDPARVLRALRLASRAGLGLESATRRALVAAAPALSAMNLSRCHMELHAMMAYGSAAPAMDLLWRYAVLDVILPQLAAYLKALDTPRDRRRSKKPPPLLFRLLEAMDRHASPLRPLAPTVWTSMLMAALVAQRCSAPGTTPPHPEAVEGPAEGWEAAVASGDDPPTPSYPQGSFAAAVEATRCELAAAPTEPQVLAGSPIPRAGLEFGVRALHLAARGRRRDGARRGGKRASPQEPQQALAVVLSVLRDRGLGWTEACGVGKMGGGGAEGRARDLAAQVAAPAPDSGAEAGAVQAAVGEDGGVL